MGSTATVTRNEAAQIRIDKTKLTGKVDITAGSGTAVTFQADQDCVLHFNNRRVFDCEYLPLKKNLLQTQTLKSTTEQTEFEVLVPVAITPDAARGPWPIVPRTSSNG